MLNSLRRHATGWVAKVLFGILVLSFAIWGIGDIFRAPHGGSTRGRGRRHRRSPCRRSAASSTAAWQQMQEQFGAKLDRRAAVSLGVLQQALDAAVARRLVDAHARDLEPDGSGRHGRRQPSATIPRFQGVGGFERERFELLPAQLGMSEADYVAAVRGDMVRNEPDRRDDRHRCSAPRAAGPQAASSTGWSSGAARRWSWMRRRSRSPAPSEDALTAYLAANAKTYEAPEYRSDHAADPGARGPAGRDRGQRRRPAGGLRCARSTCTASPEQRRIEQLLAPRRGDHQARGRARRPAARASPQVADGAEGRQGRALRGRPAGQGRPAGGPRCGRLRAGPGRGERARCRRRSAGICCAPQEIMPEQVAAVRGGQGGAAPRGQPRARDQPAARCRHPARRRAGGRHGPRRRGATSRASSCSSSSTSTAPATRPATSGSPPTG